MSPFSELKDKPILTILLALLIASIGIIGAMNQTALNNITQNQVSAENRLWNKLDRVTHLMEVEKATIMQELKDTQKLVICHDRDIAEIRERIRAHLETNGSVPSKKQ